MTAATAQILLDWDAIIQNFIEESGDKALNEILLLANSISVSNSIEKIRNTLHDPKIKRTPEDLALELYRKFLGTELLNVASITIDRKSRIASDMKAFLEALGQRYNGVEDMEYVVFMSDFFFFISI